MSLCSCCISLDLQGETWQVRLLNKSTKMAGHMVAFTACHPLSRPNVPRQNTSFKALIHCIVSWSFFSSIRRGLVFMEASVRSLNFSRSTNRLCKAFESTSRNVNLNTYEDLSDYMHEEINCPHRFTILTTLAALYRGKGLSMSYSLQPERLLAGCQSCSAWSCSANRALLNSNTLLMAIVRLS